MVTASLLQLFVRPASKESFISTAEQLPDNKTNGNPQDRNVKIQDQPRDIRRGFEQVLAYPRNRPIDKVKQRFSHKQPCQACRRPSTKSKGNDRRNREDCPDYVAACNLIPCDIRHRKSKFLRGKYLQGDISKCVDPEKNDEGVTAVQRAQPRHDIPGYDQKKNDKA